MYNIKLSKEQLSLISEALVSLPYFRVVDILANIGTQMSEQDARKQIEHADGLEKNTEN